MKFLFYISYLIFPVLVFGQSNWVDMQQSIFINEDIIWAARYELDVVLDQLDFESQNNDDRLLSKPFVKNIKSQAIDENGNYTGRYDFHWMPIDNMPEGLDYESPDIVWGTRTAYNVWLSDKSWNYKPLDILKASVTLEELMEVYWNTVGKDENQKLYDFKTPSQVINYRHPLYLKKLFDPETFEEYTIQESYTSEAVTGLKIVSEFAWDFKAQKLMAKTMGFAPILLNKETEQYQILFYQKQASEK